MDLNKQLIEASIKGDLTGCKELIDQGANNFNEAIAWAVYNKNYNENIVRLMLTQGANNYNYCICIASMYGHIAIVKLMLENGATSFNKSMYWAAYYGYDNIVRLMLEKGANNFNEVMNSSERNGNKNIIRLLLEHGADFDKLPDGKIKDKIIKESREEYDNLKMVLEHIVGDTSFAILMSDDLIKVYNN